jgi:hypothetical protein
MEILLARDALLRDFASKIRSSLLARPNWRLENCHQGSLRSFLLLERLSKSIGRGSDEHKPGVPEQQRHVPPSPGAGDMRIQNRRSTPTTTNGHL